MYLKPQTTFVVVVLAEAFSYAAGVIIWSHKVWETRKPTGAKRPCIPDIDKWLKPGQGGKIVPNVLKKTYKKNQSK